MSHVVEEVEEIEEIKRIVRLSRSRKSRTAYYIHAALRTKNDPSSSVSQEKSPDCIVDLSPAEDDQEVFFSVSRRRFPPLSPPPHRPSRPKTQKEQPLPPFWENDPVTLHALSILGLDERATLTDVKKQWRKLAQKLHPDKGGNTETFIRARTAYETLIVRSRSKAP
jgi:hypothetical protein